MITFMGILKKHKFRCIVTTVGPLLLGKGFCHGWLMGGWGFKIPDDQRVSFAQRSYFPKKNHKSLICLIQHIHAKFFEKGGTRVAHTP